MTEKKYTHLLLHKGPKFNEALVKMINDETNGFNPDDHRFVTQHRDTYEALKAYGVILDRRKIHRLMNDYCERSEWVFVHDIRKPLQLFLVKNRSLNRMVWRTWGSDSGIAYRGKNAVKRLAVRMINPLLKGKYRRFRAVGVANAVDIADLEDKFGKMNFFPLGYPVKDGFNTLQQIAASPKHDSGVTNVLIEHSGYDTTHIRIMKMLEQYRDEAIHLYIVLAYGLPEYIRAVRDYAESVWKDKVTIVTDFRPYGEYMRFLHEMDIAVFDEKQSYALGNIQALVLFRKKIYLNRNGVIRRAFDQTRAPYAMTDEIPGMPFQRFAEGVTYADGAGRDLMPRSYEQRVEEWHTLLGYLDKEGDKNGK